MGGQGGLDPRIFRLGVLPQTVKSMKSQNEWALPPGGWDQNRRSRILSSHLRDIPLMDSGEEEGVFKSKGRSQSKRGLSLLFFFTGCWLRYGG